MKTLSLLLLVMLGRIGRKVSADRTLKDVTPQGVNKFGCIPDFVPNLVKPTCTVKDKSVERTLEEVGQKLRQLRQKKGYTSAESFAYDHDLPRVHYWRIEKGKVNLTLKSLHKILLIHKMTIEEFFVEKAEN